MPPSGSGICSTSPAAVIAEMCRLSVELSRSSGSARSSEVIREERHPSRSPRCGDHRDLARRCRGDSGHRTLFWGVAVLGVVAPGALSWVLRDVPVLRTLRRGGGARSERGPRVPVAGDLQGCRSGLVEHPHDRFPRRCRPAARGMETVQSMIMTGPCMAPGDLILQHGSRIRIRCDARPDHGEGPRHVYRSR